MKLERKQYDTRNQKIRDLVIGFAGWFVVNGLFTLLLFLIPGALIALQNAGSGISDSAAGLTVLALPCLWLLLNLGGLIYFGLTRRWIALGGLLYFGVGLALFACFALMLPNLPSLV